VLAAVGAAATAAEAAGDGAAVARPMIFSSPRGPAHAANNAAAEQAITAPVGKTAVSVIRENHLTRLVGITARSLCAVPCIGHRRDSDAAGRMDTFSW